MPSDQTTHWLEESGLVTMTTGQPILLARWPTRLVVLLLLLCGLYGGYRTVHLAITNDEVGLLTYVQRISYSHLLLGIANSTDFDDRSSRPHFLNALLAKPCVEFLPLDEIVARRLPSLLGLALFLWGVWRIGLEFPTGVTRVLITLALLSNAFLLDFFSVSHGYGLALGFTVLSLSFLMQASALKSAGDGSARRQVDAALWLACGAALSAMAFIGFYAALLGVVVWLSWRNQLKVYWWINAILMGIFFVPRVIQLRDICWGGDTGFVHDTLGSLVRASFYDRLVSAGLVQLISGALALLVLLLVYRSHRERIRAAVTLSVLGLLVAAPCIATHELWNVKYPEARAAVYLVPLVILIIGVVAAWSRLRWLRLFLWGLLLAFTGIGLQGANLSHTFTWRECADIPTALLALREVHQRTGQRVTVAMSASKWTVWYYAEHLLGLQPVRSQSDVAYWRTYGWLNIYDWSVLQTRCSLPPDNPLIPGTTHLLLNLHNRDDQRLLATPLPGGLRQLHFYPASDTTLEMLIVPQRQGAVSLPDGRRYMGEFEHGLPNGQGTLTWPDGQKYVGEFKDGAPDGQGTGTWPDGRKYVGEHRDGVPNGQGAAASPDGQKYMGEFKDGAPNGQGTLTWLDGQKYVGEFRDGQPDGVGKMT